MCNGISGGYLQERLTSADNSPKKDAQAFGTHAGDLRMCQYGEDWLPVLYSVQNGGYNVYHRDHNFSKQGNGGYAEKIVGMVLAVENGKQVEFLPEKLRGTKCPDFQFDGYTWDVKSINLANENTIRKCIRNGRKADRVLFYWQNANKLESLKSATERELGNSRKRGESFPGIFYLNAEGKLQEIKIKSSESPFGGNSDCGAEGVGIATQPSASQR